MSNFRWRTSRLGRRSSRWYPEWSASAATSTRIHAPASQGRGTLRQCADGCGRRHATDARAEAGARVIGTAGERCAARAGATGRPRPRAPVRRRDAGRPRHHLASSGAEIERRVEAAVAKRIEEFASLSAVLATLAETQKQLAKQIATQQNQFATQMANQEAFNMLVAAALGIPLPDPAPILALQTPGVSQP